MIIWATNLSLIPILWAPLKADKTAERGRRLINYKIDYFTRRLLSAVLLAFKGAQTIGIKDKFVAQILLYRFIKKKMLTFDHLIDDK